MSTFKKKKKLLSAFSSIFFFIHLSVTKSLIRSTLAYEIIAPSSCLILVLPLSQSGLDGIVVTVGDCDKRLLMFELNSQSKHPSPRYS